MIILEDALYNGDVWVCLIHFKVMEIDHTLSFEERFQVLHKSKQEEIRYGNGERARVNFVLDFGSQYNQLITRRVKWAYVNYMIMRFQLKKLNV